MDQFFVFMEDFHQIYQLLIKCVCLIVNKKFLIKVLSLILCGLIHKIYRLGEEIQEELDGYLDIR